LSEACSGSGEFLLVSLSVQSAITTSGTVKRSFCGTSTRSILRRSPELSLLCFARFCGLASELSLLRFAPFCGGDAVLSSLCLARFCYRISPQSSLRFARFGSGAAGLISSLGLNRRLDLGNCSSFSSWFFLCSTLNLRLLISHCCDFQAS
jgi:hypothetical protein